MADLGPARQDLPGPGGTPLVPEGTVVDLGNAWKLLLSRKTESLSLHFPTGKCQLPNLKFTNKSRQGRVHVNVDQEHGR